MKKSIVTSILAILTVFLTTVKAQEMPEEYLGLPGDNLNLYAVMKLFQESKTLESFERDLNDQNSMINNLDLNGDNRVDYIMVSDYVDRNVHTIVLRVALNRKEYQDVAVFTVERFSDGSVQIQLIGDEALYGKNYIIEPYYAETPNPGYTQKRVVVTTYYEVAYWPLIRFIYLPDYVVWRSAWYWGYYPAYWHAWNPYYWHYYYGYHYNWHHHYYSYYHHWDHYRCHRYNDFYCSHIRVYSPTVVININKGHYHATYSRPEQRRQGEALYARRHSMDRNGTVNRTAVKNQEVRSSGSQSSRVRKNGNASDNGRKASTTIRTRTGNNSNAQRNTGTVRSTSVESRKRELNRSSAVSNITPERTRNTSAAGRTVTRTSPAQNKVNTPAVNQSSRERSVSRSSMVRNNAGNSRPSSEYSSGTPTRKASVQRTESVRISPSQRTHYASSSSGSRNSEGNNRSDSRKSSSRGGSTQGRTAQR